MVGIFVFTVVLVDVVITDSKISRKAGITTQTERKNPKKRSKHVTDKQLKTKEEEEEQEENIR